jgi:putative hydrolase of the HAD superfamily
MQLAKLELTTTRAVGFDFFNTLVQAKAEWETCILSMAENLQGLGYGFSIDQFISNYREVAIEYRKKRYENLQEVGNNIIVADALRKMGISIESTNPDVTSTVEHYFNPWKLTIAPDAHQVLEKLSVRFTISLISNFTNSAFIHRSLNNLGIDRFFDHVIDSVSIGWRKPHPRIFKHFLNLCEVKAEEAVFIGDDLNADIKGAKNLGIKAVLFVRSRNIQSEQKKSNVQPDHIVYTLSEFGELLLSDKI